MKNKINFAAIDFMKIFFALGIVALHTGFLLNMKMGFYIHNIFFRLGVPFFFLCSGYFLAVKINEKNHYDIIKTYIKRLLLPYIILSLIYLLLNSIRFNTLNFFSLLEGLWNIAFLKSQSVMWFVGSLIAASLILLLLKNKKSLKAALLVALGLYIVGLFFNTYVFLFNNGLFHQLQQFLIGKFGNNSNAIFCGFFFFGTGFYLKKYFNTESLKVSLKTVISFILSFCLLIFEVIFVKSNIESVVNAEYYLSFIVLIPTLFILLLNIKMKINTIKIRNLSTWIYYLHYIVILVLIFINTYHPNKLLSNSNLFYLITVGITVIFSYIFQKNNGDKLKNFITFLYVVSIILISYTVFILFNNVVWADEICSLQMAKHSIMDIIKININDVHPPLYYILIKIFFDFFRLLGFSISTSILGKVVSFIPLLILIIFFNTFIRKKYGNLSAALLTFIFLAAPQFINYFVEIRMYSWGLCLVSIAFVFLLEVIRKGTFTNWLLFTLFCILASYTHLFSCLAIGIMYFYLFIIILLKEKSNLKKYLISALVFGLGILPWMIIVYKQLQTVGSGFWIPAITIKNIVEYVYFIFSPNTQSESLNIFLIGLTIVLILLAVFKLRKNKKVILYFSIGVGVLILLVLIGVIVSILFTPVFVARYMVVALGCFWIGIIILFANLINKNYKYMYAIIVPVLVCFLNINNFVQTESYKKNLADEFYSYVNTVNRDAIIVTNTIHIQFLMDYYLDGNDVYIWNMDNTEAMKVLYGSSIKQFANSNLIKEMISEGEEVILIENIYDTSVVDDLEKNKLELKFINNYIEDMYSLNVYQIS